MNPFLIIGLFLFISKIIFRYLKGIKPTKTYNKLSNFAILIPARDESKVIEDLLISIRDQSLKVFFKDVYVITESINDKTNSIASSYGANVIIREKLELKRKGYALMEAIEKITKDKEYNAYFIFDADNVLDKDYFKYMEETYKEGYDIGIGKRKIKNKTNSISTSSHLIFTLINEVDNKNKSKNNLNLNASGTGFYITGKVINKFKTYPFHTLTEDYEISLYATVNNLTMKYNDKAIFYDEQPTTYKAYFNQRTRWVKGYFEARRKYACKLDSALNLSNNNFKSVYNSEIGVIDLIFIILGILPILLKYPLFTIFAIYLGLIIFTIYLIHLEKLDIDFKLYIKTILMNPLLLLTYVLCLFKAIFSKDDEWTKIEHKEKLN